MLANTHTVMGYSSVWMKKEKRNPKPKGIDITRRSSGKHFATDNTPWSPSVPIEVWRPERVKFRQLKPYCRNGGNSRSGPHDNRRMPTTRSAGPSITSITTKARPLMLIYRPMPLRYSDYMWLAGNHLRVA